MSNVPIANIPFFKGLGAEELGLLMRHTKTVNKSRGAAVFEVGHTSDALYVIMEGECVVYVPDGVTRMRRIAELKRGDYFGEMGLIDGRPRSASVICETDVELLRLDAHHFDRAVEERTEIARKIMRELCRRIRSLNDSVAIQPAVKR